MANLLVSFFVLVICFIVGGSSIEVVEKSRVYIVYLGEKKHEDPQLTVDSHHEMLAGVVGSKKLASDLTIHNYKHGFSGFAAKLTESQAQKIGEHPDVVHIVPNTFYKLQTSRSWDYLDSGLGGSHVPNYSNIIVPPKNVNIMGDNMIIGIIDSGIWPESRSFNDEGLGPIPARWKGKCVSGQDFNATQHCNRKIIGAQYINDGFLSDYDQLGVEINMTVIEAINVFSARDVEGHGTHVASTAAGSFVANASYKGLGTGTVRGGAPMARIAVYKVGWMYTDSFSVCSSADVIRAMDLAVHDGVDVINLSLGSNPPIFPEVDRKRNKNAFASFHAMARGITVVYGSGNNGPEAQMVDHPEPWVITVAASTIDRYLPTPITLGNNKTVMARGLLVGQETGFTSLLYSDERSSCNHYSALENATVVDGKVVLCFVNAKQAEESWFADAIKLLADSNARGMVIAKSSKDEVTMGQESFQIVEVDYNVGTDILKYTQSTSSPTINLGTTKSVVGGQYASTRVAYFSSRGPNSLAPAILKPDITAPGVDILAAVPDHVEGGDHQGFMFKSGTSMAAPHITGIVALLKQAHPKWSPAALKSAMMTTAWNVNQYGLPITAGGIPKKIADPFDIGAGIVNPNSAIDPGLVYDMDTSDYVHYLCAMGYDGGAIGKFVNQSNPCPKKRPSILDVNLPSITIPSLKKNSTTVKRTVTNVGPVSSTYKAIIQSPGGTVVSVRPDVLSFNSNVKQLSFDVTVTMTHPINVDGYNFGSLTWTDGGHYVRIPVSVKADVHLYL